MSKIKFQKEMLHCKVYFSSLLNNILKDFQFVSVKIFRLMILKCTEAWSKLAIVHVDFIVEDLFS